MLVLRCTACKKKLWRYDKIGQGEVLRCHKARINKLYNVYEREGGIFCSCGRRVGIDKGGFFKMIARAFTCKGTKRNG